MTPFENWIANKKQNWVNFIESVEQQRDRIIMILNKLFPHFNDQQKQQLFSILQTYELQLASEDDKRRSYSISKFLSTYQTQEDSFAHTLDRFKRELQELVYKSNSKNKTPEQMQQFIAAEVQKRLPGEPKEIIDNIIKQVNQGVKINDAINSYLASKNKVGSDKVIAKEGSLELIEIANWQDGDKEKHIDPKQGLQSCHPLFKGTSWCVRFKNYFDQYQSGGRLYFIREFGKPLALGHSNSEWLDVDNENPDSELMKRIASFVLPLGINDLLQSTIMFLPDPIRALEKYKSQYDQKSVGIAKKHMVGVDYQFSQDEQGTDILTLTHYVDIYSFIRTVQGRYANNIDEELKEFQTLTEDISSNVNITKKDLVEALSSKMEDFVIEKINKNYRKNYYGKIPGWQDMDLEECLEYAEDIKEILYNAYSETIQEETERKVYEDIKGQFEGITDNGFYLDTANWDICVLVRNVNESIRKEIDKYGELTIEHIDKMDFSASVPDNIEPEFSDKVYNKKLIDNYAWTK